jgi:anti-sigma regulatory factor (Ser/Thr protein kinase)
MARKVKKGFSIPNDTKYLSVVRETVREVVRLAGFPEDDVHMLTVAVDEAVANIIEHGFEPRSYGRMEIEIQMAADEDVFEAIIRDCGSAFDPSRIALVNIKEHVRAGRKNGLGIFLMQRIMDRVIYSRDERNNNQLRLVKYAGGGGSGGGRSAEAPPA